MLRLDYRTVLNSLADSIVVGDLHDRILHVNPAAELLLGWTCAELRGQPLTVLMPARMQSQHTKGFQSFVDTGQPRIMGCAVRLPALHKEGRELDIELALSTLALATGETCIVATIRDLADRVELERQLRNVNASKDTEESLRFLTQAGVLLGSSLDYHETLRNLARLAVPQMADWCSIHLAGPDGAPTVPFVVAHADPTKVERAQQLSGDYPSDPTALRGALEVLCAGRAELYSEVSDSLLEASAQNAEHLSILRALGMKSAMVVPLKARGGVLGLVSFVAAESGRRYAEGDLALAVSLAERAANAIENARLYAAEKKGREQLELLARAGEAFAGASDYEDTLLKVVQIALPALADFAFFDVLEGSEVRRITAAYEDPQVAELIKQTKWMRSERRDKNLCALSSGEAGMHPKIDDAWLQDVALSAAHLDLLRRLSLVSLVTVPLRARGDVLGSLTLCFGRSGRQHTVDDLNLAEELARRAGIAVVQATLYEQAQAAAKRAEAAAQRAEEASSLKDEFLNTVSHELRTPLSAILGWANMLGRNSGNTAATLHKGIQVIERNARSQLRIVEDILDVSRIVRGQLRLETQALDLQLVVSEALESVNPAAEAKRIVVTFDAYDGPCRLVADPERLRQVLWNLLSNAVKFTDQEGTISVSVRQAPGSLVIQVRDTGWGISSEFLPHVFDRFRQADGGVNRGAGGLGLGLAIVRHLVEMHGGTVTAESPGLGLGSTFSVRLPVKPFSTRVAAGPVPSGGGPEVMRAQSNRSLSGWRLLLVEDEADSRDLIELLLTSTGANVRAVASAEEALQAIEEFVPDVLVSDIGMAELDGYWLIEQIRKSRPLLPAVALTAFTRREDVVRAHSAGFNEHVAKPVDPDRLVQTIASLRSP